MTAVLHLHAGDHVHTRDADDPHHVEDGIVVEAHLNGLGQEVDAVRWPHGEWGLYLGAELEPEIVWGAR